VHKTTDQIQAVISKTVVDLQPLLRDVENRLGGIAHGLLDRVKVKIEIEIVPVPKAEPVNPES
jgi:hypothetical protein